MRILRPSEITEFPAIRPLSPEEVAEALALSRAAFTAADLQQFTEELVGTPMEEFLQELEEDQRRMDQGAP